MKYIALFQLLILIHEAYNMYTKTCQYFLNSNTIMLKSLCNFAILAHSAYFISTQASKSFNLTKKTNMAEAESLLKAISALLMSPRLIISELHLDAAAVGIDFFCFLLTFLPAVCVYHTFPLVLVGYQYSNFTVFLVAFDATILFNYSIIILFN